MEEGIDLADVVEPCPVRQDTHGGVFIDAQGAGDGGSQPGGDVMPPESETECHRIDPVEQHWVDTAVESAFFTCQT